MCGPRVSSRTTRGLVVCALIGLWVGGISLERKIAGNADDSASAVSDLDSRVSGRIDDLDERVGSSYGYGGHESRVGDVERRAEDMDSRIEALERKARQQSYYPGY